MTSRNKKKYFFIILIILISGIALADSLGIFNPKPYTAVTFGAHVHYVPKDRNPKVSIDKFPMVKPGPDEKITPTGQIVKKSADSTQH